MTKQHNIDVTRIQTLLLPAVKALAEGMKSVFIPSSLIAKTLNAAHPDGSANPHRVSLSHNSPLLHSVLVCINDAICHDTFCAEAGVIALALDTHTHDIQDFSGKTLVGIVLIADPDPMYYLGDDGTIHLLTDKPTHKPREPLENVRPIKGIDEEG